MTFQWPVLSSAALMPLCGIASIRQLQKHLSRNKDCRASQYPSAPFLFGLLITGTGRMGCGHRHSGKGNRVRRHA
ncbi:hypothetical protein FN846DRAFT_949285 [Sphaerosporella brunnea]|uniref:Uncharacterized protein n=1 Tax=Sphaerosporella brunnea TaxID=1250544 RepID=A0A5J5EX22_9PEZI|nr:hypothetical protein FN846DRAFT_949285 [Sphaerosporella brunnea]